MKRAELRKLTFITGNQGKLKELSAILNEDAEHFELVTVDFDCPEIQDTVENIAIDKAQRGSEIVDGPIIVEDVGLFFNALNGLPGPYIKWFLKSLHNEGLVKLLENYDDKSGYAQCSYAFIASRGAEPKVFTGITNGTIVEAREGTEGFGWDPIFLPEGSDKTFAEMSMEQKNEISHRRKASTLLREHLLNNEW